MKISTVHTELTTSSAHLDLYCLGDIHKFSDTHDAKLWAHCLKELKSKPNAYSIVAGDLTDDDRPSTRERRRVMYSDRPEAYTKEDLQHMDYLDHHMVPDFKSIAPRCLGILDGDHFRMYADGTTSTQYICKRSGIPYLGERMAWVRWIFKIKGTNQSCMYTIYVSHGQGSASTIGGDINSLIRQVACFDGDLMIGGHTHKHVPVHLPILYPSQDGTHIKERLRTFVRVGSFMRGYLENKVSYVEQAGYTAQHRGWCTVHLTLSRSNATNRNLAITEVTATH